MIAGDLRDEIDFLARKMFPRLATNEPRRMFVMFETVGRGAPTDVVQASGGFQQDAIAWTQPMPIHQRVEKLQRQRRDLQHMLGFLFQPVHDRQGFLARGFDGFLPSLFHGHVV